MPLSAGEFVLPSFGGDPGQGLQTLTNRLYMRNYQQQRLALQAEAKRQQSGQFLERFLDPKQYLSGTAYDPMIISSINEALQKGAQMAEQGADIPTMLMGLGQYTSKINDYSNKAKLINKQADDTIAKLKETGAKGYDFAALKDEALKQAFHHFDDKSGQDLGLQDINNVDPSRNFVMETLQKRPDMVTNAADIDEFANKAPKQDTMFDITDYDKFGKSFRRRVGFTGQNYLTPEYDTKGKYVRSVPQYEHATDGGSPLMHTTVDENGQQQTAPVRLLDNGVFNYLSQQKGVGDYLRGQVMKHIREYNSNGGTPIDLNSPQAHLVARAIAYDELAKRASGGIKDVEQRGKPSGPQEQEAVFGTKFAQAFDSELGRLKAMEEEGVEPGKKNKPLDVAETTHQIFNNNPDYLPGKVIDLDGKGRHVIDITGSYQGAEVKGGHGEQEAFSNVYYDPQKRSLITENKLGERKEYGEKELPTFMRSIAGANKMNPSKIDKSFRDAGYKDGKYEKAGPGDPVVKQMNEQVQQQYESSIKTGLDDLLNKESGSNLQGLRTPKGEIVEAGKRSWFNPAKYSGGKYYITYKNAEGKTKTEDYDSRAEMEKDLGTSSTAQPAAPAATQKGDLDKL